MIVRTAQYQPKSGLEEAVLASLRSHVGFTRGFPGCRRAYLGTPIHGRFFLVHSEWDREDDVERFEAAVRTDPRASSDFFSLLAKLAAPPAIARYTVLE